jgi:hypothetical protein
MPSTITFDPFKWRIATKAVELSKPGVKPLLTNLLFGRPEFHADNVIDYQVKNSNSKIAQYASDEEENPNTIQKDNEEVYSIKLPRTFEQVNFTAKELNDYKELLDENPYVDADQRLIHANRMVLAKGAELKQRVLRRREVQVAEAIVTGKVISNQDNVKFTTSFGFVTDTLANGGHILPALTSTDVWGGTTADVRGNLMDMIAAISNRTGRAPEYLILTNSAAREFIKDDKVKADLDNLNYQAGRLTLNDINRYGGIRLGNYLGLEVIQYNQKYQANNNIMVDLIPDGGIAMTYGANDNNRLHIGGINYIDENNRATKIMTEYHVVPVRASNGKFLKWTCEQYSLPAIHEPNAFLYQKVC